MFCPFALIETLWNRSSYFLRKIVHFVFTSTQEEMRYEGSQVKEPPITRRRMTPLTPMQNSYTSFESEQGSYDEEGRGWNARERTIVARMKQYLETSFSVKVWVEELEGLLGPGEVDVDFRRILKETRDEQGRNIIGTFSSNDMSFLVAEWSRWDMGQVRKSAMETRSVGICK